MNFNFKKIKKNQGFTYVELIVVLSIFAVMSSVVLFNYGKFQAQVDIKNLANDIGLQIVQAQKDATNGKLQNLVPLPPSNWIPAYGVNFNLTDIYSFKYFSDYTNPPNGFDVNDGPSSTITLPKREFIQSPINIVLSSGSTNNITNSLSIVFKRPSNTALFYDNNGVAIQNVSYVVITIKSPTSDGKPSAAIWVYPSGVIRVK